MHPFLDGLLKGVLLNAGKGAIGALEGGGDWKTVALAGGLSGLAGLLSGLLNHPAAKDPMVLAAIAAVK